MSGIVRRVIEIKTGRIARARIREEYEDEARTYDLEYLDNTRARVGINRTIEISRDLYERIQELEYQLANYGEGTDLIGLSRSMFVDLARFEILKNWLAEQPKVGEHENQT